MPVGQVTRLNLTLRRGFVTCPGKADLRFDEADLVDVPFDKTLRGKSVVYNEEASRATHLRLAK